MLTEPGTKTHVATDEGVFFFFSGPNIQPPGAISRMAPVVGGTWPLVTVSSGSEEPQQRCLRTFLATHHLWTILQTAAKVHLHTLV